MRVKYGKLLDNEGDEERSKPVFRTESQDRMLKRCGSSEHQFIARKLNTSTHQCSQFCCRILWQFVVFFLGTTWGETDLPVFLPTVPYEDQYHQLITIEAPGFNNTLAPYSEFLSIPTSLLFRHATSSQIEANIPSAIFLLNPVTCPNSWQADLNLGPEKTREWIGIYLAPALVRLQADVRCIGSHPLYMGHANTVAASFFGVDQIEGLELTLGDLYSFQLLCAYETVALGGSKFCDLFTGK